MEFLSASSPLVFIYASVISFNPRLYLMLRDVLLDEVAENILSYTNIFFLRCELIFDLKPFGSYQHLM